MKRTLLLLLTVTFILLIGCQTTPEEPAVVGKDLEQMLALATSEIASEGGLAERLDIPERYESYVEDAKGGFKVTINADIILPEADSLPIIRVEAQPFDQQTVDRLIDVLFEPGQLYEPYRLAELTKSEISQLLDKLAVQKMELEHQGMKPLNPDTMGYEPNATEAPQPSSGSVRNGNQLDQINASIKALGQQLDDAPQDKQLVEVTGKFQPSFVMEGLPDEERKEYEGKRIEFANMAQMNPAGGMRSLYVTNYEPYNEYRIEYINGGDFATSIEQYYAEDEWYDLAGSAGRKQLSDIPDPVMTAAQLQEAADRFLEQLGIDYLACVQNERVVGTYGKGDREGTLYKAYRLQYVRMVQKVPVTHTYIDGVSGSDEQTIWNWAYEKMTLIVDDNSVKAMTWTAPYRLLDTVTSDTNMLPFSKVKDIFEKMILIGNSYYTQIGADMNITEIRLGLMRITEQDNQTKGLLIPVWDFFGTLTTHYEENGEQKSHTLKEPGQVWLTINAINGSIIDRSVGY